MDLVKTKDGPESDKNIFGPGSRHVRGSLLRCPEVRALRNLEATQSRVHKNPEPIVTYFHIIQLQDLLNYLPNCLNSILILMLSDSYI